MSTMNKEWLVIGISGVTCGGKTTLANKLKEILAPVYVFHQDKYFYLDDSPHHVKCDGMDHNNYDILSSLDMEGMHSDILKTMRGGNMAHAFNLENKVSKYELQGKSFIIVEGFTALNYEPINNICDLRYYFVLEYGECAARRCLRLYDPPDIPGYFDACVWPSHLVYRRQIENDSRVTILDGRKPDSLQRVLDDLQALGAVAWTPPNIPGRVPE